MYFFYHCRMSIQRDSHQQGIRDREDLSLFSVHDKNISKVWTHQLWVSYKTISQVSIVIIPHDGGGSLPPLNLESDVPA